MIKFLFVLYLAVASMQQTEAFKVVTIQKATVDPAVLIQGVQSAIAGKIQQVQTLVGSLIEQKIALKQHALNSIQNTIGGLKSKVSTLAGSLPPPLVIRKNIYFGVPKPATPDCTTANEVDDTTISD